MTLERDATGFVLYLDYPCSIPGTLLADPIAEHAKLKVNKYERSILGGWRSHLNLH